jgi:hypothetical protein
MERNYNLDILKVLLSLFVVAAHILPTTLVEGEKVWLFYFIHGFARLTVPIFLIITGYFVCSKLNKLSYLKKTLIKFFKLFLVWQLVYLTIEWDFFVNNTLTLETLLLDLVFGIGHLWYLSAICFCLIILYLIRNFTFKANAILIIFFFVSGYILQVVFENKYCTSTFFTTIYKFVGTSRNSLFFALPYLLIGKEYNNLKKYISNSNWIFIGLFMTLLLETYLIYSNSNIFYNILLSSLPLSVFIFHKTVESKNLFKTVIPDSLSLGIYLIHFYCYYYLFVKLLPVSVFDYIAIYFLVLLFTLITWYLLDKLNSKIKIIF